MAAISLVIGVAACGGGDADDDRAAATIATAATDAELPAADETMIPAEFSAAVRAMVDRLGPDAAFAAEVLALDAGYGADQIVQHASELTADGTIPGVAPTGPPSGVFGAATAQEQGLRLAAEKTPAQALANLKAKAHDEDTVETLLGTVLFLAGVGYSAEQILDGLLFGEQRYARTALQGLEGEGLDYTRCILLAEQDGTLITPAGPSTVSGRAGSCAAGVRNRVEVLVVIDGKWVEAATPLSTEGAEVPSATETPDVTETDDLTLHGRYEGELDIAAMSAAVGPEVAAVLTVSENVVVADVDAGRLVSLTGALQTYNPEIVQDDGGICENDARLWFEADVGSAASTDNGFEVSLQWSSFEKTGDCGGFSPTEGSESGVASAVGRIDQESGGISLDIEFFPDFVLSGLLVAVAEGTATSPPASNPTVTTTTTTLPVPGFQFTASEFSTSDGRFRGERRADWSATFSTQDGVIAGSGTVSGVIDGECQDSSDAPFGPVSLTLSGSYRITGTVSEGVAQIRLVTNPAVVDLTVGDTSKECVQSVMRLGETTAQFPIGDPSPGGLALELPEQGGSTTLEYPSGKTIEVSVSPLG